MNYEIRYRIFYNDKHLGCQGGDLERAVRAAMNEVFDYMEVQHRFPFRGMKNVEDLPFKASNGITVCLDIIE